jgi:CHASE3 domain sensor protein
VLYFSGVFILDVSTRELDMKNTVLFMVMAIIYALSSEMDYLDAEMMRRNGRDMIATTPQGDGSLQPILAQLDQHHSTIR